MKYDLETVAQCYSNLIKQQEQFLEYLLDNLRDQGQLWRNVNNALSDLEVNENELFEAEISNSKEFTNRLEWVRDAYQASLEHGDDEVASWFKLHSLEEFMQDEFCGYEIDNVIYKYYDRADEIYEIIKTHIDVLRSAAKARDDYERSQIAKDANRVMVDKGLTEPLDDEELEDEVDDE